MMYHKKFVGVVKVGGKIVREHDSVCRIPFGEEYSILLKNLNCVKAFVKIQIDGKDVLNNYGIILDPNSDTEIEGFFDGYMVSHKFKFIKKTKEIQNFRGDRVDDGMIRIEYTFEKPEILQYNYWTSKPNPYPWIPKLYYSNICNNISTNVNSLCNSTEKVEDISSPLEDEGITVKGNFSNQRFTYGNIGPLENNSEVIVLYLKGTNSYGKKVKKAIATNEKVRCGICGRVSKSSSQFCNNCGNSLI